MEFYKWSDEYSVGNAVLDNEHKQLFNILNELYTAFMNHETMEKLGGILSDLHNYTIYHFSHEEELLKERNHPLSLEHIRLHKDFIGKVASFKEKHENGLTVVQYEMMNFLNKWLIEHIQGTDKDYSVAFG